MNTCSCKYRTRFSTDDQILCFRLMGLKQARHRMIEMYQMRRTLLRQDMFEILKFNAISAFSCIVICMLWYSFKSAREDEDDCTKNTRDSKKKEHSPRTDFRGLAKATTEFLSKTPPPPHQKDWIDADGQDSRPLVFIMRPIPLSIRFSSVLHS